MWHWLCIQLMLEQSIPVASLFEATYEQNSLLAMSYQEDNPYRNISAQKCKNCSFYIKLSTFLTFTAADIFPLPVSHPVIHIYTIGQNLCMGIVLQFLQKISFEYSLLNCSLFCRLSTFTEYILSFWLFPIL